MKTFSLPQLAFLFAACLLAAPVSASAQIIPPHFIDRYDPLSSYMENVYSFRTPILDPAYPIYAQPIYPSIPAPQVFQMAPPPIQPSQFVIIPPFPHPREFRIPSCIPYLTIFGQACHPLLSN